MSQYYYAHLKLFILAHAVKFHAVLMAEGSFLRGEKCETYWENELIRQYTPTMNKSVDGLFTPSPENNAYGKLLLAQIAVQCRDREWAGQATAYLTSEALGIPVKLLSPLDVVRWVEFNHRLAAKDHENDEAKEEDNLYEDNRYSATYVPRGGTRAWRLRGDAEGRDFCPEEVAVVLAEHKPAEAIDLSKPWRNEAYSHIAEINMYRLMHYAAIVHESAIAHKKAGPPFALDLAAPPPNMQMVSTVLDIKGST